MMSEAAVLETNRIAIPADFPVTWPQEGDAELFWAQDRLHYPDPVTPLEFSMIEGAVDAGITAAARAYEIALTVHDRHINSYLYVAIVPDAPGNGGEAAQASEAKLRAAMAQMETEWLEVWLPEIQRHLAFWQAFDLSAASLTELLAHLCASWPRLQRVWEIHFLLFLPSMLAISQFADLYGELWEDAGALEAYSLLGGFPSKTMESAESLWRLSRLALASPLVANLLADTPPQTLRERLAASAEGRLFLAAWDGYLHEHGYRGDKLSLHYPFWVEDPTPVLKNLRDSIAQPDRDFGAERAEMAAQRQRNEAHALAYLQHYPQPVRTEFTFLLRAAQAGMRLKEDHGYWIDYKSSYCMRQIFLECGRRLLAAGLLHALDDVFYLSLTELQAALARPARFSETWQVYHKIDGRKAVAVRFADVTPPAHLGRAPSASAPDDPLARMFLKIEGSGSGEAEEADALRGSAGAPGVVRGPVKILRVLGDALKLQPGDILVAESTAPPWTPLFASVAGVITDSGGALSHSAVIAREYGIPAVVGVGTASRRLRVGQIVEVNGHLGIVKVKDIGY
jgi:phosphohistidine swiveling domain-containing protein